jgi:hypothetical protein
MNPTFASNPSRHRKFLTKSPVSDEQNPDFTSTTAIETQQWTGQKSDWAKNKQISQRKTTSFSLFA